MTDSVRPVGPIEGHTVHERREGDRRGRDRRAAEAEAKAKAEQASRGLVPAGERVDHAASPAKPAVSPPNPVVAPPALFAAQVLGQKGQKRGLKGGPPVLDAARSTYLGAEYSGKHDRRPRVGKARQTEV
ncbi:hypothetical protein [Brevundimonas sp. P7753]|uniref:hypothetical protein n=1 Tax=Brevundimonas sp. P7753 TaxID=2726982 RepID=UPI0015B943B4|nr:hypothetical protein [Brevundimonas sp. P7753]NWE51257.1 hypothetical protein [Brevundimonas sp. P7753]